MAERLRRSLALRRRLGGDELNERDLCGLLQERLDGVDPRAGQYCYAGSTHPYLVPPFASGGAAAEEGVGAGAKHCAQILEQLRQERASGARPWYMIDPRSTLRKLWDMVALINIYALLVSVPLEIAFFVQSGCGTGGLSDEELNDIAFLGASENTRGTFIFSTYTAAFFAVDVVLNFFTGVAVPGEDRVVYDLRFIAKRYACSYLVTDVLACLPLNCIMTSVDDSLNYFNTGDLLKLVRLHGLSRREYGSPFQLLDRFSEVRQEFSYQARRLISYSLVLLEVVHCFACLNWLVLRVQHFPPGTWPVVLDVVEGVPVAQQWLYSFFNVVSGMIGLSYGAYPPITWPETLVWIFCMITVAVMFAFFNGLVITFVMSATRGDQEFKDKMDRALFALKNRNVPVNLRRRIMDFFAAKYGRDRRVPHDDEVLRELPPAIRSQVALLSCGPLLSSLPLFTCHPLLLEDVAPLLQRTVALPGQVILQQEHILHCVVFIQKGLVDLSVQEPDGSCGLVDTLGPSCYFAELALLPAATTHGLSKQVSKGLREDLLAGNRWRAPFTATALTSCELVVLHADDFQRVLRDHPDVMEELEQQANGFLARVAAALEEQQSRSAAAEAAAGPGGGDSWRSNGHGGSSGAAVGAGAEAASPPQGSTLRLGRIERSMTMPPLRGARVLRVLTML